MEDFAAIKQRHADELEKARREAALATGLPVEPERVHDFKDCPWIVYKRRTRADAAWLLALHEPIEAEFRKLGCLSLAPFELQGCYADGAYEGSSFVSLMVHGGRGFGPDVELEWFTPHHGHAVRMKVEITDAPLLVDSRVRYGHYGQVEFAEHTMTEAAPAGARRIKWSTGSLDAYRFSCHWTCRTDAMAWLLQ